MLSAAAAIGGATAVCVYGFDEPLSKQLMFGLGGPISLAAGQAFGSIDGIDAIIATVFAFMGDFGAVGDVVFSGKFFGGILFVKLFGGRSMWQGVGMTIGALAAQYAANQFISAQQTPNAEANTH